MKEKSEYRRTLRSSRGQLFGAALAVVLTIIGVTTLVTFGNICLAVYYQQKLTHLAAICAQEGRLHRSTAFDQQFDAHYMNTVATDSAKAMGLPLFNAFGVGSGWQWNHPEDSITTKGVNPFRNVLFDVPLALGDRSLLKDVNLLASSRAHPNSQVGWLHVPAIMSYSTHGTQNYFFQIQEPHGVTTPPQQQLYLPIIKSPPTGMAPIGSWYLYATPPDGGPARLPDNRGYPPSAFATRVPNDFYIMP